MYKLWKIAQPLKEENPVTIHDMDELGGQSA